MEEHVIIGEGSEYPLDGLLTLPNKEGKFPVVILIHGSGATDMDETIYVNKPFLDIAKYLAAHDIATLRYNKRAYQYKKKVIETSKKIPITVFDETIEDALLAKELMLKHANIDQNNIFILGHSLGGMLAPRIDQMGGEFKGIIIMAGSPRSLRIILQEQTEDSIKTMNKFLQLIAKKQIKKLNEKLDLVDSVSEEEAKKTKMIGGTTLWYFREMEKFDLETTLKELKKPIFIVQGANDLQVSTERDFKLYQAICHDNECITLKLYPNLNHLFMPSIYNDINKLKKEYKIAGHVDETVLVDICNFILSNLS